MSTELKKFAFIYNLPSDGQVVLWPAYYEDSQEELKDYEQITEYNITNLAWSSWLANNQPYIVLQKKQQEKPVVKTTRIKKK
jgi:hypothetical protein